MKFIIPEVPVLEKEEDRFTGKYLASYLAWLCKCGLRIDE